jgi:ubiquinone biosynthesis monooxygenase Coq7
MTHRTLSRLDRTLVEIERALGTVFDPAPVALRPSPAEGIPETPLDTEARRDAAGLMRVNHVGEVCAQALYFGQAAFARDDAQRARMLDAASEETDHLAWCGERLRELDSRPSLLNPLWYAGAYAIGAAAGLVSDRLSLGFVVETERQVEQHLEQHLARLPDADSASRAVVQQMRDDEARHGAQAQAAGATALPAPVRWAMRAAARVMTSTAHHL